MRTSRLRLTMAVLIVAVAIASTGRPVAAQVAGARPGSPAGAAAVLTTGGGGVPETGFSCVIIPDGSVRCWGKNGSGQLGRGDNDDRGDGVPAGGEMGDALAPVELGTGRTAIAIDAGASHACALLDTHQVKCWGINTFGQLGIGETESRGDEPGEMGDDLPTVELGTGRSAVAIAVGGYHGCAVLDTGQLKCWGHNNDGQLGLGDVEPRGNGIDDDTGLPAVEMGDELPAVDLGEGRTAIAVAAGHRHTCVLLDTYQVKCWGYGGFGQLGLGDPDWQGDEAGEMGDLLPAIDLGPGRRAIAISAGSIHTCAVLSTGAVKCWGDGVFGRLGLDDEIGRGDNADEMGDELPPVPLGLGRTAVAVSAGGGHTCAVLDNGRAKCWGRNTAGQLGLEHSENIGDGLDELGAPADEMPSPSVAVGGPGVNVLSVSTSGDHTCALLDTGRVKCWGVGDAGQLGYDSADNLGDDEGEMPVANIDFGTMPGLGVPWPVVPAFAPPSAPPAVMAVPAVHSAALSWLAPTDSGGIGISRYRIQLSTDGGVHWSTAVADTGSATPSHVVSGLTAGVPVRFRVAAINPAGMSPWSMPTAAILPTAPPDDGTSGDPPGDGAMELVGVTPARLLDTRSPGATIDGLLSGNGPLPPGGVVEVVVAGRGGVPADARAVAVNVTVVGAPAAGFATLFPCSDAMPTASILNHQAGEDTAATVDVGLGTDGRLCLYSSAGGHALLDVFGFHPATAGFTPIPQIRLADTRSAAGTPDGVAAGGGPVAAGSILKVPVAGRGAIGEAPAVTVTVTAVGPAAAGFLTAWDCANEPPVASNLNYRAHEDRANSAVVGVGGDGTICIFTSAIADVLVDATGTYPTTAGYVMSDPQRLLDTRPGNDTIDGIAAGGGPVAGGATIAVPVAGRGGVPAGTDAVAVNLTAVGAVHPGYATIWPCDLARPNASNINYRNGDVANLVYSKLAADGTICVYTSEPADYLLDLAGHFVHVP